MPESDSLGARLRLARTAAKLTQEELAARARTTQRTLSSWESGATEPSATAIKILCQNLDVSADYLIGMRSTPSGLEPDSWIIDLDALDALKSTWAAKVPRRLRIVDYAELERLEAEANVRMRKGNKRGGKHADS